MRSRRLRVAAATLFAAVAVLSTPGAASAAVISQPFSANSGDACQYGVTEGSLGWQYGPTTTPLPLYGVDVTGKVIDRPLPAGPSTQCRDDGYASSAIFVAYAGTAEVDREVRTVNNGSLAFTFTLGGVSTTSKPISKVVVQVCRNPVVTLPPSYCGPSVTYLPPPVA